MLAVEPHKLSAIPGSSRRKRRTDPKSGALMSTYVPSLIAYLQYIRKRNGKK